MNEKNKIKGLCILVLILAIILCLFVVSNKNKEKEYLDEISKLNEKISSLQNTPINVSDEIILDGHYAIPETDSGWEFTSSGKAAICGNVTVTEGIYKTIGKNLIVAHYTKNTEWLDDGSTVVTDVDWYDYILVDENKEVYVINPDGMSVNLKRYGEAVNIEND